MRTTSLLLILSVVGVSEGRAFAMEFLQFTFGGVFTATTGSTHQVGDPFTTTLIFDPLEPGAGTGNPIFASFSTFEWDVPSTGVTTLVFGRNGPSALLETIRTSTVDTWQVRSPNSIFLLYNLAIEFPAHTLPENDQPVSLDLSRALSANFAGVDSGFGLYLTGTIHSLTVQTIPEPATAAVLLSSWCVLGRRGRER